MACVDWSHISDILLKVGRGNSSVVDILDLVKPWVPGLILGSREYFIFRSVALNNKTHLLLYGAHGRKPLNDALCSILH